MRRMVLLVCAIVSAAAVLAAPFPEPPPKVPADLLEACTPQGRANWLKDYDDLKAWYDRLMQDAGYFNDQSGYVTPETAAELERLRRTIQFGMGEYDKSLTHFKWRMRDHKGSTYEPGTPLGLRAMLNFLDNSDGATRAVFDSHNLRRERWERETVIGNPLVHAAYGARIDAEMSAIEKRWPKPGGELSWIASPHMAEDEWQAQRDRAIIARTDPRQMETNTLDQLEGFFAARCDARQREATRELVKSWNAAMEWVYGSPTPGESFEQKMKDPATAAEYYRRCREADVKWRNDLDQARLLYQRESVDVLMARTRRNTVDERLKYLQQSLQAAQELEDAQLAEYLGTGSQPASGAPPAIEPAFDVAGFIDRFVNDAAFEVSAIDARCRARLKQAKEEARVFKEQVKTIRDALVDALDGRE